tara:strand:+ start:390 stop:530 length:141 start_codon:yes stop_codon:yes gene_type:complete
MTPKEKIDKVNALEFPYEKRKLIYEWVKTSKVSLQQFLELIELTVK